MSSSILASQFSQLNLYRLPNEMWIAVFEAITSPSDLFKVIQTCKHFYQLAIRVLYRSVQWTSPLTYARNAPFWLNRSDAMADVPTSLLISISHMPLNSYARFDPQTAIVEADGTWKLSPPVHASLTNFNNTNNNNDNTGTPNRRDEQRIAFFASKGLYDAMARQILNFTNLRELTFHRAELPSILYSVIQGLPQLRHLTIQYCTFPAVGPLAAQHVSLDADLPLYEDESDSDDEGSIPAPSTFYPDFSALPLTYLKLWGNKGDTDSGNGLSNSVYALHLCTAATLQTLKIDWTPTSARFLAQLNPNTNITLPPDLHHLTLRMPTAKIWPSEDGNNNVNVAGINFNAGFQSTTATNLLNPLQIFLVSMSSLRSLSIVNRLPTLDIPAGALPNLKSYAGPMGTILAVLKGSGSNGCIRHLEITDVDKKVSDFVGNFLPAVARGTEGGFTTDSAGEANANASGEGKGKQKEQEGRDQRGLWTLSVVLRDWDNEILFAITQHFPELRKVKIRYEVGHPSEVGLSLIGYTLLSLGAQFLHRLTHLKKLHIYQIPLTVKPTAPRPLHPTWGIGMGLGMHNGAHAHAHAHAQHGHIHGPLQFHGHHHHGNPLHVIGHHDHSDSDDDLMSSPEGMEYLAHSSILRHGRARGAAACVPAPQGPQASRDDEEVRDLIVPWRKYAAQLREVQFVEDAVWRRAWDGDMWCKRRIRRERVGSEAKRVKEVAGRSQRDEYDGESDGDGLSDE